MLKFYQADVFAGQPFGGNPVAVFPDAQGLTDFQLQQIAREMNLSETVFVLPPTDKAAVVRLRIFTPTQEIPFAGHPVLGTFYVLAQLGLIAVTDGVTRLMQECNIGLFPVELHAREGRVTHVVMTQPKPLFLGSVDACVQGICRMPMMYAIVHENYHRALVRRFPYAIFYEYSDDRVTVYCVFQTAQDPDKWRERLS